MLTGDSVSKKPLAVQDQVATDEKGRRRFHGAFTGGFSAGYFNTVGTKHGRSHPHKFDFSDCMGCLQAGCRKRSSPVANNEKKSDRFKRKISWTMRFVYPWGVGVERTDNVLQDMGEFGIAPRQIVTARDFVDELGLSTTGEKRRLAWEHSAGSSGLSAEASRLADLIRPVR
jgi:hypothetical protein